MKYYLLWGTLLAAISSRRLYIINTQDGTNKMGDNNESNKMQIDMFEQQGIISTEEQFLNAFKTDTSVQCLNKMYYLLEKEK